MKTQKNNKILSPALVLQELAQANANVARALADVALAIRELQQLAEDALPDPLYNQMAKKRAFRRRSQISPTQVAEREEEAQARSAMERLLFPHELTDAAREYLSERKFGAKTMGTIEKHMVGLLTKWKLESDPSLTPAEATNEARLKWKKLYDKERKCFVLNTKLLDGIIEEKRRGHAETETRSAVRRRGTV